MEAALSLIEQYTGKEMYGMLEELFRFSSAGLGNVVFAVIALWAGSRASFAIMRITNYTLTEGQSTGRNYFIERIRAIKTMIITVLTISFSLIILAYGRPILEMIINILGIKNGEVYVDSIWMWLRWILGFALYFLMISYNYYILPTERVRFRKVLPGSIFAAAGMLIVTFIYSKYTGSLADYDLLYGALSSVVAIMFWFYFIAWVMCLGVCATRYGMRPGKIPAREFRQSIRDTVRTGDIYDEGKEDSRDLEIGKTATVVSVGGERRSEAALP